MKELKLQHDGPVLIATGRSRKATEWKNRNITWSELVKRLLTPHRTSETFSEYMAMPKQLRDEIKDIGGFVGGVLQEGRRKANHVKWRSLVTLDADYAKQIIDKPPFACVLYTTHSHSLENPRFRLVIPLSRPVKPEEYEPIARRIAADLNIEMFDPSTYQAHRLFYWPSVAKDGVFESWYQDAPWLDPDEVLSRYDDWRDVSEWPISSREIEIRKREAKKQADPREKEGIVGAFCRTYTISEAIEKFLPDVYEPAGPDRYTYTKGTTTGGLAVYDDDTFAYSFHATDPISGKLVNAFDLVRLHLFGHLDDNPNLPTNQQPSYKEMVMLAEEDPEVQETMEKERLSTAMEDFQEGRVHPRKIFFDGKTFSPMRLGQWFLNDRHGFVLNDELYLYEDGVYKPGERIFHEVATAVLKDEFRTSRVNEALAWVKNSVPQVSPDQAVDTGDWLNVKNGLIHLKTGEFKPHTPDLLTTIQLPVEYDPAADCPAIKEYFSRILEEDCIPLIEEIIGHCLTPSMKYEKAVFLTGDGGNGKGTLLALITALLGDSNVSSVSLQTLTENRFASAELFGKLANLNADIPPKYIEDSSRFKELVSGDLIYAEKKYKPGFQFRNRAKLIFSMNEIPATADTTYGFFRRQLIIPFNKKFNDRELRERIFDPRELSGLLNLALEGLRRLERQGGFSEPPSVKAALEEYRGQVDSAYRFLTECCEEAEEAEVEKKRLYDAYKNACIEWGVKPVSQIKFNKRLQSIYPSITEYRKTPPRRWRGLRLLATEFESPL